MSGRPTCREPQAAVAPTEAPPWPPTDGPVTRVPSRGPAAATRGPIEQLATNAPRRAPQLAGSAGTATAAAPAPVPVPVPATVPVAVTDDTAADAAAGLLDHTTAHVIKSRACRTRGGGGAAAAPPPLFAPPATSPPPPQPHSGAGAAAAAPASPRSRPAPAPAPAPPPPAGDSGDADASQDEDSSQDAPGAEGSPPMEVDVVANSNAGVYLVERRAVRCLCAGCAAARAADPEGMADYVVSPTEFERHSGIPCAKKWRFRCGSWGCGGTPRLRPIGRPGHMAHRACQSGYLGQPATLCSNLRTSSALQPPCLLPLPPPPPPCTPQHQGRARRGAGDLPRQVA
jgi:hypothetical protein